MTMDESFTVLTSARSWWSLARGCLTDPGMSVYYVVLKWWSLVAGTSLADLRLFSVVTFAVAALGAAWLGVRRGRPLAIGAALAAASLSPIMREAAFDARAASLGVAGTIWLLVLFDRIGSEHPHRWGLRLAIVGSLAVAFVHPSTLFVGVAGVVLGWRTARRAGWAAERRLAIGSGVLLVLGTASAGIKSGAATVARPGWDGVSQVLGELPGGRALTGLALLASAIVLLAGCCFDTEPVVRWFGGSALLWFAAVTFAFPMRNLFVPRYFAAATVLIVISIAFARIERWAAPMAGLILALAVVGGFERITADYGYGSTWCDVSDRLAERVELGDSLTFAASSYQSPVIACLGSNAAEVLRGRTLPWVGGELLEDPRTLWFGERPTPTELLSMSPTGTSRFVWIAAADPEVGRAVDELAVAGASCRRENFGEVLLASCVEP